MRTSIIISYELTTLNCISAHVYGQNALAGMQLRNGASGRTAAQETLRNGACPPTIGGLVNSSFPGVAFNILN